MQLTADYLQNVMTRCLPLRNIVLIPGLIGKPESDKILSRLNIRSIVENLSGDVAGLRSLLPLAERFREFPWQPDKGGLNSLLLAGFLIEINNAYLQFRWSKPGRDSLEPEWFFSLPREIKGHLRTAFFLSQLNPYLNFPVTIPFTGMQYIFRSGGPMDKLILNSDFERLAELGQLANLILWDHNKKNNQPFPRVPEHSRFTHSMRTHGLMDPVTFNNCRRLPPLLRLTLSVSSPLHDIGMPAGGDGIKPLNPKYLAEEEAIVEVLKRRPWQRFFREIGVSSQLVIDIIRNEDHYGLGELLSWMDRIEYTAGDTFEYLGGFCQKNPFDTEPRDFFIGHPDALTVWDCIELVLRDGKYLIVFNNPEKLGNFLELRALNFRHVYYAPESRSRRTLETEFVGGYLVENGRLDIRDLRRMTDAQLNRMVIDFLQIPASDTDLIILNYSPTTELFRTHREALLREFEILQREHVISITEICENKINPATQEALTRNSAGEIRPFSEVFPDQSRRIEKISHLEKPFYLHYLRNPKISPEIARTLRNYRKKEIRRILKK